METKDKDLSDFGSVDYEHLQDQTLVYCSDCKALLLMINDNVDKVRLDTPLICCNKLRLF